MSDHGSDAGNSPTNRYLNRAVHVVDTLRGKIGASRRQFAVFAALVLVASALWARPGSLLLWHRLRIITGIPRMAIANEDPELLAQSDEDPPKMLDAGQQVRLDDTLHRDPFQPFAGGSAEGRSGEGEHGLSGLTPGERIEWLTSTTSMIRLTGTAKGLGTAVLDGRAHALGKTFEAHGALFRLAEVRSGAVVLEAWMVGEEPGTLFLLDRSEAVLIRDP